jgi:hypothetical protein
MGGDFVTVADAVDVIPAYNAAVGKELWTMSRASSAEWGYIHCGVCVFLATSQGIESHWIGSACSLIHGKFPVASILDFRGLVVWAVLRG